MVTVGIFRVRVRPPWQIFVCMQTVCTLHALRNTVNTRHATVCIRSAAFFLYQCLHGKDTTTRIVSFIIIPIVVLFPCCFPMPTMMFIIRCNV